MRSGKGNREYEKCEEGDLNSERDGASSNTANVVATGNTKGTTIHFSVSYRSIS